MSFKHSTVILSLYNHLYCAVVMFSLWRIKQMYHALNYANYEEWGWINISIFLWATVTLPPTSSSQTLQQWVIMRCHCLYNEYTMIHLKSREVCPLQRTLNWMGKNIHRVGVELWLWCSILKFTFPFSRPIIKLPALVFKGSEITPEWADVCILTAAVIAGCWQPPNMRTCCNWEVVLLVKWEKYICHDKPLLQPAGFIDKGL